MKDLTSGKPLKTIAIFALPMLIGNLFQIFYTIADGFIVGWMLGDTTTAAIGASIPLANMIIGLATGLGGGFALVVARNFGAKDYQAVKRNVASIFVLGIAIVLGLTLVSLLFLKPILQLLNTSPATFDLSYRYLSIIVGLMIFTFLYNICAGILRAIGDSLIPIIFLIITTLINIGLDYLFLLGFKWGIEGIAFATILSQFTSFVICYTYMYIRYPHLRIKRSDFHLNKGESIELLRYGWANSIIYFIIQIGSVSVQRSINSLDDTYIQAQAIARKIDDILMSPFGSFGGATSMYVAQNYGAKKYQQIKKGLASGIFLAMMYCLFIMSVLFVFCPELIKIFTYAQNIEAIKLAKRYLYFNFAFYPSLAILFVLRSSLQAYGHKAAPIGAGFIEMGIKVLFVLFLIDRIGYDAVIVCEPLIWCASIALLLYAMFRSFKKFEIA